MFHCRFFARHTFAAGFGFAVALHAPLSTSVEGAQQFNSGATQGRQVTLQQQLTVGLKAFTKSDKDFIDTVVLAVEQGRLPRKLVDSTFLWARERSTRRSYSRQFRPMVYFQPGLTFRARRLGVNL